MNLGCALLVTGFYNGAPVWRWPRAGCGANAQGRSCSPRRGRRCHCQQPSFELEGVAISVTEHRGISQSCKLAGEKAAKPGVGLAGESVSTSGGSCVREAVHLACAGDAHGAAFAAAKFKVEMAREMLPTADAGSIRVPIYHTLGSAMPATAVLFIIDLPPALGAETHRIEPVLVVAAADGVIVAVTVGAHFCIGASIGVLAVPLSMACGVRNAGERSSSHRHCERDQEGLHRRPRKLGYGSLLHMGLRWHARMRRATTTSLKISNEQGLPRSQFPIAAHPGDLCDLPNRHRRSRAHVARDRHLKSPALGRHRHSSSSQRVTTAGLTCEITFPIPEITAGTFPGLAPDRNVTVSNLSPETKSGVATNGASWWVDDEPLAATDLVTLLDEVATRCWVQWEPLALRVLSLTSTSSIPRFLTPTSAATRGKLARA